MNPKDMTDEHLNITLSKLMGRTDSAAKLINYGLIAKYCTDPAASLEVQSAAVNADAERYVKHLADVVPLASMCWDGCEGNMSPEGIAWLLDADPRQRAEAAYMTLQEVSEHET